MPFTPAHIAAVVPVSWLTRKRLPLSALAIGAMSPDLVRFFPSLTPSYDITHSIFGMFAFSLPVGLIIYTFFKLFSKKPLANLLPGWFRQRLASTINHEPRWKPKHLLWAAVALPIGAATHIFWDSFTHWDRWGTNTFPSLHKDITLPNGAPEPIYSLLQNGSSALGLIILAWLANRRLKKQPTSDEPIMEIWQLSNVTRYGVWVAVLVAPFLVFYYQWARWHSVSAAVDGTMTTMGALLVVFIAVYSIAASIVLRPRRRRVAETTKGPRNGGGPYSNRKQR